MLASWFRLKYPHIAIGAFASSAPILYFDDITPQNGYLSVVTKDFKEASESCYSTIRESWFEIDRLASQPNGLTLLSEKFQSCNPLNSSRQLKEFLVDVFSACAQYDAPPAYPVNIVCRAIDGEPQGTDILGTVAAGVKVLMAQQCLPIGGNDDDATPESLYGWDWQVTYGRVGLMKHGKCLDTCRRRMQHHGAGWYHNKALLTPCLSYSPL